VTLEVSEGLLYFLKYPLLLLLYVFLATALRAMTTALPTPKELATPQTPSSRRRQPTPPSRRTSERSLAEPVASPEDPPEALRPVMRGAGRQWLEVVTGMEAPVDGIPIQGPVVFGRLADCPVRIPDPFVSGHHARLTPGPEGTILEDLGSRNGTWLGQERLEGPVRLQDGDHFAVGDVTFRYRRT